MKNIAFVPILIFILLGCGPDDSEIRFVSNDYDSACSANSDCFSTHFAGLCDFRITGTPGAVNAEGLSAYNSEYESLMETRTCYPRLLPFGTSEVREISLGQRPVCEDQICTVPVSEASPTGPDDPLWCPLPPVAGEQIVTCQGVDG